ncbi:hypothetical protein JYT53_00310 [Cytophagaceae bacterium AH-315-L13]|nr:hypothetical protein [Cytophagaceae bacterium AH-315-L13]
MNLFSILFFVLFCLVLPYQVLAQDNQEYLQEEEQILPVEPTAPTIIGLYGPRVGVAYVITSPEEFTNQVNKIYGGDNFYPIFSVFAINLEQRILLGETNSHFAFQEIILIGGVDQGILLPSGTFMIGYRHSKGFEFGMGPNLSFSGLGLVAAIGKTFSTRGVFIPIDISLVFPNQNSSPRLALTTGFNFVVK